MQTSDWESIRGGRIPWSASEYYEVLEEVVHLMQTPHDDWDREPRALTVHDEETGEEMKLQLNVDDIAYQIDNLLLKRYMGESHDLAWSHTHRFHMMSDFMKDNIERLMEEGLVGDQPEEGIVVEEPLIEVLATAKYEAATVEGDKEFRVFDYNRVVQEVRMLQAEQDQEN